MEVYSTLVKSEQGICPEMNKNGSLGSFIYLFHMKNSCFTTTIIIVLIGFPMLELRCISLLMR